MYKKQPRQSSQLKVNQSYVGETIEKKVARITQNKEPITDGAPLIYTERRAGVGAEYDIRTDRWEVAVDAMDKVTKAHLAKREDRHMTPEERAAKEAKVIDINKGNEGKKEGEA